MLFFLIWGEYNRDEVVAYGQFDCPQCGPNQDYVHVRVWQWYHLFLIPLVKNKIVREGVVCLNCDVNHRVSILSVSAGMVDIEGSTESSDTVQIGNIVELNAAAVAEVIRRHVEGQSTTDDVVRVEPHPDDPKRAIVSFDYVMNDDSDWLGDSHQIPIVVAQDVAAQLSGKVVDFRDGEFWLLSS